MRFSGPELPHTLRRCLWPPHRAPIVLTILSTRTAQNATYDNALIAKAAKVAISSLA
jgi:beta-lactamase class A